jgi:hypothetical protein
MEDHLMRRHLRGTAGLLALTGLLTACSGGETDRLANALGDAGPIDLYAPKVDGKVPARWALHPDGSVTLSYGKGAGFAPTLTIREASPGSLCADREPEWDACDELDDDAVVLGFEEMNAVVVRRAGTELLLNDFSLEVPDENFESPEAMAAWRKDYVDGLVDAVRDADSLTPEEFVEMVPDGKIDKAA